MVMVMMHIVVVISTVMTLHDHGIRVGEASKAEDGKTKNEKGFHLGRLGLG